MTRRRTLTELAPKTRRLYERLLVRAFGSTQITASTPIKPGIEKWAPGTRRVLEYAITRCAAESGFPPEIVLDALPVRLEKRRKGIPRIPGEVEAEAYRAAAMKLPIGKRAMALLPLALGLRANEVMELTRENVQHAVKTGELRVMRKGRFEQTIPAEHARDLLVELLQAPSSAIRRVEGAGRPRAWRTVGEILSDASSHTRYQLYHRLVRNTGKAAGIEKLRPHLLRHAFATRMNRDGAPLPTIQHALGHASPQTTAIYVHPAGEDMKNYLRPMSLEGAPETPPKTKSIRELAMRQKEIDKRIEELILRGEKSHVFAVKSGTVLVSPAPSKPGRWRVTNFDHDGDPTGHVEAATYRDALRVAREAGVDFGVP